MDKDSSEYKILRNSVIWGKLSYFKLELIHLLYKGYMNILKKKIKILSPNNRSLINKETHIEEILKFNKDFEFIEEYKTNISNINKYFINYVNNNDLSNDKYFNNLLNIKKKIIISKYSFEVFCIFLEENKLIKIQTYLLKSDKDYNIVLVYKKPESDLNIINYYLSEEEIKKNNSNLLNSDLLDVDYYFYKNLCKNNLIINEKYIKTNFIYNLKYLYSLTQSYINNFDFINKPNILNINIMDLHNKISYTCITYDFNFILFGYLNGKIKIYKLNNYDKTNYSYNLGIDIKNENKTKNNKNIEVITLLGHYSTITSIKVNINNDFFISSDADGFIRLWCLTNKSCISYFKFHYKTVWDIDLFYNKNYFISCSEDGFGLLWNLNKNKPINNFELYESIPFICKVTYNMMYSIFGCFNNNLYIYDNATFNLCKFINIKSDLIFFKILRFRKYIFIIENNNLIIYDLDTNNKKEIKVESTIISIETDLQEKYLYLFFKNKIVFYNISKIDDLILKFEINVKKSIINGIVNYQNLPIILTK